MTRPDWCDEQTWADALTTSRESIRTGFRDPLMPMEVSMTPIFARALFSAKEEARKEERERAAKVALDWPHCSWRGGSPSITNAMAFEAGASAQAAAISVAILNGDAS